MVAVPAPTHWYAPLLSTNFTTVSSDELYSTPAITAWLPRSAVPAALPLSPLVCVLCSSLISYVKSSAAEVFLVTSKTTCMSFVAAVPSLFFPVAVTVATYVPAFLNVSTPAVVSTTAASAAAVFPVAASFSV